MQTPRIVLIAYKAEHLLAMLDGYEPFARSFGYQAEHGLRDFLSGDDVSESWRSGLATGPQSDVWVHGFAVLERQSQKVIGNVGFTGPPSAAGEVEIAYCIVPSLENRGYATEAASCGLAFAKSVTKVRGVIAHTLPLENASTRVLVKCGFQFSHAIDHPIDGSIWEWRNQFSDAP